MDPERYIHMCYSLVEKMFYKYVSYPRLENSWRGGIVKQADTNDEMSEITMMWVQTLG